MDYNLKIKTRDEGGDWRRDAITPKQRAFLEFVKLPVPSTKGQASDMIGEVRLTPRYDAMVEAWDREKYRLHPSLYGIEVSEPSTKRPKRKMGCLIAGVCIAVAVLGVLIVLAVVVGFLTPSRLREAVPSKTASPSPTEPGTEKAPSKKHWPSLPLPKLVLPQKTDGATPEPSVNTQAKQPSSAVKPSSDLLSLQSIEGKIIEARVLAVTNETVLVRRDDGKEFEIPLARLTSETLKRIEEHRAAKRAENQRNAKKR